MVPASRAQINGLSRRVTLGVGVAVLAGIALLAVFRLGLYGFWQLPAPQGDGVLFASVAQYHCSNGQFGTPIFPLDPSGSYRYVWHGIGWPWLLSLLNPQCSISGGFMALTLVMLSTLGLVGWGFGGRHRVGAFLLAVVVLALQAKLGFRPETLAIMLVLLAHALRSRADPWIAAGVLSLLAWVQPTVAVLAAAHAVLTLQGPEWRRLARGLPLGLPALVVMHALIVLAYPFPIADLMQGLGLQGRQFAQRDDGSLFVYFVRSDFFPLLGLAMCAALSLSAWRRPVLLLLLPALF
ncbi:MAG: hypothetical protein ACO1OR_10135 [Hydrogenophaga sp.]|jgi:hypothetical protein